MQLASNGDTASLRGLLANGTATPQRNWFQRNISDPLGKAFDTYVAAPLGRVFNYVDRAVFKPVGQFIALTPGLAAASTALDDIVVTARSGYDTAAQTMLAIRLSAQRTLDRGTASAERGIYSVYQNYTGNLSAYNDRMFPASGTGRTINELLSAPDYAVAAGAKALAGFVPGALRTIARPLDTVAGAARGIAYGIDAAITPGYEANRPSLPTRAQLGAITIRQAATGVGTAVGSIAPLLLAPETLGARGIGFEGTTSRLDTSVSLENQARQAFELRNYNRTNTRELMSDRISADRLTREEPNLRFDQLVADRKSSGLSGNNVYQSIIDSSGKTRVSVNQQFGLDR